MSETTTYPTPAADELAAIGPIHEEIIGDFKAERTKYWDDAFTVDQLRDAMDSLGVRAPAKGTAKPVLVGILVDEYDLKKFDDRPGAIAGLAQLKRRADEERYILAGIRDHDFDAVNAEYKSKLRLRLDVETFSPDQLASTAEAWQEALEEAVAWRFIALTINQGKTPHKAAQDAVRHFTYQLIVYARSNGEGGSVRSVRGMQARQATAYAKFVDRLTILDGIVDPA